MLISTRGAEFLVHLEQAHPQEAAETGLTTALDNATVAIRARPIFSLTLERVTQVILVKYNIEMMQGGPGPTAEEKRIQRYIDHCKEVYDKDYNGEWSSRLQSIPTSSTLEEDNTGFLHQK